MKMRFFSKKFPQKNLYYRFIGKIFFKNPFLSINVHAQVAVMTMAKLDMVSVGGNCQCDSDEMPQTYAPKPVSIPASKPVSKPVSQPVSRPATQSVSRPVSKPAETPKPRFVEPPKSQPSKPAESPKPRNASSASRARSDASSVSISDWKIRDEDEVIDTDHVFVRPADWELVEIQQ